MVVHGFLPSTLAGHRAIDRWRGFGAVMLFCDRLSEQEALEARAADRENLLEMLLSDFRQAFPDLKFELQLDFKIINALALTLQGGRIVTIYGGLALHPKLSADSLAFILLHETGHHLAKGCRLVRDPSLACECASDYWALTTGSDVLQQISGRRLDVKLALEELSPIMSTRQKLNKKYAAKKLTSSCWAEAWTLRRSALLKRTGPPTTIGCCVRYA
jgi:hypothetical protein